MAKAGAIVVVRTNKVANNSRAKFTDLLRVPQSEKTIVSMAKRDGNLFKPISRVFFH